MLENHDKVTLKTLDGKSITRYFPGASPHDMEVGETVCPDDPHLGSALHREGYIKWGDEMIAKRDSDGLGMVIIDVRRVKDGLF